MNICVSIYIYINASWKPFMCVKIWRETIDAILWNLLLLCKLKLMHHKNCFALCVSVYMYKYLYICVCLYFCVWEKLIRHETILIYIYIYIYIYLGKKENDNRTDEYWPVSQARQKYNNVHNCNDKDNTTEKVSDTQKPYMLV